MTDPAHLLVVAPDPLARATLVDTLGTGGGYTISEASTFEEALDLLLAQPFSLAVVDVQLPDLSGLDLLAAAKVLGCYVPMILIDNDISARSALSAFRLGAIEYVSKPLNLDYVLLRVDRELKLSARPAAVAVSAAASDSSINKPARIALKVGREQFKRIARELANLYSQIGAQFVGLVDKDQNLIGAVGKPENTDLILLTKALGVDNSTSKCLMDILGETTFHSSHFEGERCGVYIIEFGQPQPVSLIVICPAEAKLGMVWLYSKRTAVALDQILKAGEIPTLPDPVP